ncbi:MAG: amidase [Oceanospirillaceae bacterium]|nr:amidase [Oceanospirillaceae bacterium]|tara:strand:+ start:40982 stop:42478 length:1497 start_codon:yes stop_codon:yes gene_type:complete
MSTLAPPTTTIPADSLNTLSAEQIVSKIKARDFSCQDLLAYYQSQYQLHNGRINAIVATDFDAAKKRAIAADEALANGEDWGPLHGLPMTIKDCFEVVGMPTTAGNPIYKNHFPNSNAESVQRLVNAGAIVFGKTNVPINAADIQSFNSIYGTTNNPWDISKTPGGSSGGAAAALAAGLSPIELGSDIGGSIRTPSHWCGIFGHKPSYGIVPLKGHVPDEPGTLAMPDLATAGPMAKTPEDLDMLLDILTAPDKASTEGWALKLPSSSKKSLGDYKVLAWFDDPAAPIEHELRQRYQALVETLKEQGAQVDEGAPDNLALIDFYVPYLKLLVGEVASAMPLQERLKAALLSPLLLLIGRFIGFPPTFLNALRSVGQSHRSWKKANEQRLKLAARLQSTFDQYDIILMPVVPTTAIPHNQKGDVPLRTINVNGEKRNYTELFPWISFATILGLPATSAPIATTKEGMPMNVQVVSRQFKDKETIQFAKLLHAIVGRIAP